jgi:4a-hydroxytetrahydrobiopterin dehydratase
VAKLTDAELKAFLAEREGWTSLGDTIQKDFRFRGFRGAIAFVNRVAERADAAGHHPDIEIHYNRVLISLSTHDAGGVTEKDLAAAAEIDAVAEIDAAPDIDGPGEPHGG